MASISCSEWGDDTWRGSVASSIERNSSQLRSLLWRLAHSLKESDDRVLTFYQQSGVLRDRFLAEFVPVDAKCRVVFHRMTDWLHICFSRYRCQGAVPLRHRVLAPEEERDGDENGQHSRKMVLAKTL